MEKGTIYWIGNWFYMIKSGLYQLRFGSLWITYSCKQNPVKGAVDAETLEVFDIESKPARFTVWFRHHKLIDF